MWGHSRGQLKPTKCKAPETCFGSPSEVAKDTHMHKYMCITGWTSGKRWAIKWGNAKTVMQFESSETSGVLVIQWVQNLRDLLKTPKKLNLVTREQQMVLDHNFILVTKQLSKDQNRKEKNGPANRYSKESKQFALTLFHYSPAGSVNGKHANTCFLVKMNFKFGSFGSFWSFFGQDNVQVKKLSTSKV